METLKDLVPGMILEGTVTNVTNFGAFVDVGVHQDGLVHISALSENYVKDPHAVVKAGDIVRVKIMEVDVQRKRVAMSMRLGDEPGPTRAATGGGQSKKTPSNREFKADVKQGTMAALFEQAMKKK